VNWSNTAGGTIAVTQTSPAGCHAIQTFPVTIVALPAPSITGNSMLCQYNSMLYTVNPGAGSTVQWTANGGVINGSSTGNSVAVSWNTNGTGSLEVVETNSFGCQQNFLMPVTIRERPVPSISGIGAGCLNNTYTYTAPVIPNTNYTWNITGGSVVSYSGNEVANVKWSSNGTNTVSLTAVNTITGCDSTVTKQVTVANISPPVIQAPSMSGCPPLTIGFSGNTPAPGQTYEWSFGDGFFSSSSIPTHIFAAPGTYPVTLITQNAGGCRDTITSSISVYPQPTASFMHNYEGGDYYVDEGNLRFTNNSTGATHYLWTFGTADTANVFEPNYTYTNPGDYIIKLFAYNDEGCFDKGLSLIRVRTHEQIYVPNAFTPNDDNVNDYFFALSENIMSLHVMIFNRFGKLFYNSNDVNFKWDGTYEGSKVELGVYTYIINAKGENGSDHKLTGTVTLVR
jgi:gliding motility-associated-like protein